MDRRRRGRDRVVDNDHLIRRAAITALYKTGIRNIPLVCKLYAQGRNAEIKEIIRARFQNNAEDNRRKLGTSKGLVWVLKSAGVSFLPCGKRKWSRK